MSQPPDITSFRRFILPFLFVMALFVVLVARRPAPVDVNESLVWTFRAEAMGTTYTVKVLPPVDTAEGSAEEAAMAVSGAVDRVNASMSTYVKTSELSRFNQSVSTEPQSVSAELVGVVQAAQNISEATGGAFDVTIGPVINVWGFGPTKTINPPSADALKEAQQWVGWKKLGVDPSNKTLTKAVEKLYVDLSAIAKGYGVDAMGRALEDLGYGNYMVELGGEIRARGKGPNGDWMIGVERPDGGAQDVGLVLPLRNHSMATSGNYRNFRVVDGKRVSHTMDARTGAPITHHVASVTVVTQDCMQADGWATALLVLGEKEGLELAIKEELAVLFFVGNTDGTTFKEVASPAFQALQSTLEPGGKK